MGRAAEVGAGTAAALLAATTLGAPAVAADDGDDGARVVFRLQDERVAEASGMVDLGDRTVLVNDSGDDARLFVLDGAGRTLAVRAYDAPAVDVEALAPAGGGAVWVGDIGDNRAVRGSVTVHRVPVDGGAVASYELSYPDGPADAESLLVDPDGRLVVVTKALAGGVVLRAPARLDPGGPNRLERVATVGEALATDAALLSPTRVLVRGYAEAGVYAWPSWEPVRRVPLPEQPQGEAVSVGPGGRVRVASEGIGTPVLQLPRAATVDPAPRAEPDPGTATGEDRAPSADAASTDPASTDAPSTDPGVDRVAVGTGLLLGGVGLAAVTWLVQRRRGRP